MPPWISFGSGHGPRFTLRLPRCLGICRDPLTLGVGAQGAALERGFTVDS